MPRFSETLLDHFADPRNRGVLERADAIGEAALFDQGPRVILYLRIVGDRVEEASFEAFGCGVTIAAASMLTEQILGRSLADCSSYTADSLATALEGIPPDKAHAPQIAVQALHAAIASRT